VQWQSFEEPLRNAGLHLPLVGEYTDYTLHSGRMEKHMEIFFDSKDVKVYKEICHQTKNIQETVESVVPDTDDDIAKVAALQTAVLLKSKDVTARGVLITGEATASLVYITEAQDKVSFVKLSKVFSIEYDVADIPEEAISQVQLSVVSADARIINPRKVSVSFEISGDVSCYVIDSLSVESGVPAAGAEGIHAKYESVDINVVNAVCEKTFSLSEQFSFPLGKPRPSRIISGNVQFQLNDTQLIGTKVMVKGNAVISVSYLSDEVNYPLKTEFNTPFSQIVDIGEENMDRCTVLPELTGVYYDLADSIGGDKLIDVELHAVLQLCSRSNRQIVYVSDAYSNLLAADCIKEKSRIKLVSDIRKIKITADERLNIMEDCADVLSLFVSTAKLSHQQSKLTALVDIDVVYRTGSGQLSSVRRAVEMECEWEQADFNISGMQLADVYLRPDGQYLDCHLALEICCTVFSVTEIEKVISVTLNEDEPVAFSDFPAVSLVRCSGESLWELAKNYCSSVEKIKASNNLDGDIDDRMILVPKTV